MENLFVKQLRIGIHRILKKGQGIKATKGAGEMANTCCIVKKKNIQIPASKEQARVPHTDGTPVLREVEAGGYLRLAGFSNQLRKYEPQIERKALSQRWRVKGETTQHPLLAS